MGVKLHNEVVILLTGTIVPNSFDTLVLVNPEERKLQYIEAISFYLKMTKFKIVFAENSGVSLEDYFTKSKNRLEFLTYKAAVTLPDRGKGFKEYEIIEHAINKSEFIKRSTYFVKITGRLKVLNINRILNQFTKSDARYSKNIFVCNCYKIKKMDSRCFLSSKESWSYFKIYGGI